MEATIAFSGIGYFLECLDEASGLASFKGVKRLRGRTFITGQTRRQATRAQILACLAVEGIKKDCFGVFMLLIKVQTGTSPTLSDTDFRPVGGAVTGALKSLGIDKRFNQDNGMPIYQLPILAETAQIGTQYLRSPIEFVAFGGKQ